MQHSLDLSYGSQKRTSDWKCRYTLKINYTLTYSAPDDGIAGNDGPSITRNVRVIDFHHFHLQVVLMYLRPPPF